MPKPLTSAGASLSARALKTVSALGLIVALGGAAPTSAPPRALTAQLGDYFEMPVTGSNARAQVARVTFLVEEPGNRRLFASDNVGALYVVDKTTRQPVRYLDFNGSGENKGLFARFAVDGGFASGLLGFTFDPDYARNGKFYTLHLEDSASTAPAGPKTGVQPGLSASGYTATTPITTPTGPGRITRHAVLIEWTDSNTRNATFEGTAREVMRVEQFGSIHPMDDLTFNPTARAGDPDWRVLYISSGDGGTGELNDVRRMNPQRLDHFGGKIMRIIPDLRERVSTSQVSENGQYRIPNDNPFVNTPGARKEIWANGMRNPHRMAWDVASPRQANLLAFVIGSNGGEQVARYETINIIKRGANYGYPLREGPTLKALSPVFGAVPTDNTLPLRISDTVVLNDRTPMQDSALAYRTSVEGLAIAGGFVYRGAKWPQLQGSVVFGDITSGRIFYARMADLNAATDGDPATLASFTEIKTDLMNLATERSGVRTASLPPAPAGPAFPFPAPVAGAPRGGAPIGAPPAAAPPTRGPIANGPPTVALPPRPLRVDMRLATDSAGEIYVMTKSDGMVRRITSIQ